MEYKKPVIMATFDEEDLLSANSVEASGQAASNQQYSFSFYINF